MDLYEGIELHVVLDNLNTNEPKRDRRRQRHPNVHPHYTPTYASWLNQVEMVQHPEPTGAARSQLHLAVRST